MDLKALPPLGEGPLKAPHLVETPVAGFSAAAGPAGIRKDGRADVALIVADRPSPATAVFTTNLVAAAPVQVARRHIASGSLRALVANSGCANAATGQPGLEAAQAECAAVAQALGCAPEEVLPASTGVIGQLLPAAKIAAVAPGLAAGLSPAGLPLAAQAIMTTDAFPKMASAKAVVEGTTVTVVGMAKGAGMIRPDMATLLTFVLTDAHATPAALDQVLRQAVALSYNRASVDGDMSTNDTLVLWASGAAGGPELTPGHPGLEPLTAAVTRVCQDLAAMLVADGEGSGHLIRVVVTGAADEDSARHLAFSVAHSQLCKTAFAGQDPNWGRIFCAAGAEAARRGLALDPDRLSLWIGDALIAANGQYTSAAAEEEAARVMKAPRYQVRLDLGLGEAGFWVLTSDLDHEYIKVNADYRS